jgi:DNA-binding HxlR family transcriptional regulator
MDTADQTSTDGPDTGVDAIYRTAEVVGDAWSWLVMREAVLHEVSRFADFHARLGAARSTLSARLATLVEGGLLSHSGPSRREYQVTERGRDFFGCLMVAMRWGDRWYFDDRSRPQPATHIDCGQSFDAVLRCARCLHVLRAREVEANRRPPLGGPPFGTRHRSPSLDLLERVQPCSIARTLSVTGEWWSSLIIRESFFGTRHFDEFERHLGIAPNILSGRLRRLVELGVLARREYQTWPSRHEYRLTHKGLDLYHVPLAMHTWGERWLDPDVELELTHKTCGARVHAVLTCDVCAAPVTRDDVDFDHPAT